MLDPVARAAGPSPAHCGAVDACSQTLAAFQEDAEAREAALREEIEGLRARVATLEALQPLPPGAGVAPPPPPGVAPPTAAAGVVPPTPERAARLSTASSESCPSTKSSMGTAAKAAVKALQKSNDQHEANKKQEAIKTSPFADVTNRASRFEPHASFLDYVRVVRKEGEAAAAAAGS